MKYQLPISILALMLANSIAFGHTYNSCESLAIDAVKNLRSLSSGASPIGSVEISRNSEQPPSNGADLIVLINGSEKYYVLADSTSGSTGCDRVELVVNGIYRNYFRH
jgi:hypothetical protein